MRKCNDLTGKRFGRLTALYQTDRRDKRGCVFWHYQCDCGSTKDVDSWSLVSGNYRSCGCIRRENQLKIHDMLHFDDGTCVERLRTHAEREDNKSGLRGVFRTDKGVYRVSLGFKRKRYYLGTYRTFDEAVDVRMKAEQFVHDGYLEAYEKWDQTKPLVFDVRQYGGILEIQTEDMQKRLQLYA